MPQQQNTDSTAIYPGGSAPKHMPWKRSLHYPHSSILSQPCDVQGIRKNELMTLACIACAGCSLSLALTSSIAVAAVALALAARVGTGPCRQGQFSGRSPSTSSCAGGMNFPPLLRGAWPPRRIRCPQNQWAKDHMIVMRRFE
ncbi:MAG: hypothetical protein EOR75_33315, partial [Mesorhizobium sp.]